MGLSADDYLRQLQALLPTGLAWPRHDDAALTQLLAGFAEELARIDGRMEQLVGESMPASTSEMLAEWEEVAGLPDNCTGTLRSTQQGRRQSLVSKLASVGGQSRAYFTQLAADLGFEVLIEEFRPFQVDVSSIDEDLNDDDAWCHTWRVRAPEFTEVEFAVEESAVEEALSNWGNEDLECRVQQMAPAHAATQFAYGPLRPGVLLLPDGTPLLMPEGVALMLE